MKHLFVVFILLSINNFTFAQKSEYAVRLKSEQIFVRHQGKTHRLALGDKIDAAKITDAEILFASRQNGFTYLLIDISGQSKAKQDDRQCGAGIEANLIWIKLDTDWKMVAADSERYESCWSGVTSDESYKITGNTLIIEFDNFREDVNVKLIYNADEPEKGFQKQSARLNNQ